MKRFIGIMTALLLIVGSWGFAGAAQASEMGIFTVHSSNLLARVNTSDAKRQELIRGKLDLNNSDVREFRKLRGFYPNLASKIIQNAPYESVDDVLDIPGLSDSQIERLQANLDEFFVTDVEASMNSGGDRYNPGVY
ncbi:photosystem II complex extrinsic protein PsbU [Pleurocapsa sp. FMAR1]|uniref:photosystem II complex extrinsic protein PsbU n=1 Tax=Pleurocapsa sp. FMAR1 TaxID=3040204 RepID=UPI0029C60B44|nr:photosystem II complex extrinsic protein PsbU [Pleurocapsa sp. FMAR1]